MKVLLQGILKDCYFHEADFQGSKYPGFQMELFNPDWTSPTNRYFTLKFSVETAAKLGLDKADHVKSMVDHRIEVVGDLRESQYGLKLIPSGVKVLS